jgi:hypothetical protein
MGTGAFIYPDSSPVGLNSSGGASVVAQEITPNVAGLSILGVYYLKQPYDTGTHVATVYRSSDQANLGSATFTSEPASGWMYVAFETPIPITNGVAYRICVSSPNTHAYGFNFNGVSYGSMSMSSTCYFVSGSTSGFPSSSGGNIWQCVDCLVDGLPAASARATQVAAEVWERGTANLLATQAALEVWRANPTASGVLLTVTQAAIETWIRTGTFAFATQASVEAWVSTDEVPKTSPYRPITAQIV